MTTRIKLRRDTAANWTSINPVLALAEPGVETDTNKMKVGDGTKTWTQLTYLDGADVTRLAVGFADSLLFQETASGEGSDVWFNTVVADSDLNSYYVGAFYDEGDTNQDMSIVAKYDVDGNLLWQKKLSTVDGWVSEGESLAIDPTNDELVIISTLWSDEVGQDPGSIMYRLNPLTGELAGTPLRIRDDSADPQGNYPNVYPYDIAMDGTHAVIVGKTSGEWFQVEAPKQTGSSGVKIKIQRSILETGSYPVAYNDWYVNGTDINNNGLVIDINDYNNVSGTSDNGNGAEFDFTFYISRGTTYPSVTVTGTAGTGYAISDVLTVAAASIGATADAHITVTGIGGSGEITTFTCTDYTPDTAYILLTIDPNGGSVDFTNSGTWNVAQARNNNGYIYSQQGSGWQKQIGDSDDDQLVAVAIDSNSNVYAAGRTYDNAFNRYRSMLVKLDNGGVLQYAKTFDFAGTEGNDGYTSVVVDSNDNVYTAGWLYDWAETDNNFYAITKINSSGTIVWQKALEQVGPFSLFNMCLAVDADDNVYMAAETDSYASMGDDYYFAKFNSSGVVQWQRTLQNWADVNTNWDNSYRTLAVKGDKFFYAGASNTFSSNGTYGSFAFSAPTDGSGLGSFNNDMFTYETVDYGNWNDTPEQQTVVLNVAVGNSTFTTDEPATGVSDSAFIVKNATMYTGPGGEVGVVKQITFEDGSVQTTASTPFIPSAVDSPLHGVNSLYLRLDHAGKTLRFTGINGSQTIYVPMNSNVPFVIGTIITIIYDDFDDNTNNLEVRADNWGTTKVVGVGYSATNPADWWDLNSNDRTLMGIYTLMKVDTDRWVIAGPSLNENWC